MAGVQITAVDNQVVENLKAEQRSLIQATQKTLDDLQNTQLPTVTQEDNTNDKLFTKFNEIILSYELENKALNGVYITNPVSENDLILIQEGRLWTNPVDPTEPVVEMIRIPEFDGRGAMSTASDYYLNDMVKMNTATGYLKNGLSNPGSFSGSASSSITPSSTSFTTATNSSGLSGHQFIAYGSGQAFIGFCSSVSSVIDMFFVTTWTVHFTFVTPITGNISSASVSGSWTGFTNSERTTKTASSGALQPLMNELVSELNAAVTAAIGFLNQEITIVNFNYDTNFKASDVLPTINAEKAFYTAYQVTTDISDTGIASLSSANTTNTTRSNNTITVNSQKKSLYYDKRFFWANERSGSGGTVSQLWKIGLSIEAAETALVQYKLTLGQLNKGMT